jgi:hypothetical protein
MDPYAPINGISLERYADLSAELDGITDPGKQAEIIEKLGVSRVDWEAAKHGWTARMQDMSLMGQVATRFMPLYQAALAKKKGPAPQVTFEDYVAMSGCVPVIGFEGMLAHYKLTNTQWTQIAGDWNNKIASNPQYMQYGMLVQQESARIRAGGQPKPVNIGAPAATAISGGAPVAAPPPAPNMGPPAMGGMGAPAAVPGYGIPPMQAPNAYAPQPAAPAAYPQANPYGQQQYNPHNPNAYGNAQANQFGAQVGGAFNAFGSALGSFVDGAVGACAVGSRVLVQWSDGNRYPGTVMQHAQGQYQIAFPDGRQVWVPQAYVSLATY